MSPRHTGVKENCRRSIDKGATPYTRQEGPGPGFAVAYLEIQVDLAHFQENSSNKLSTNKVKAFCKATVDPCNALFEGLICRTLFSVRRGLLDKPLQWTANGAIWTTKQLRLALELARRRFNSPNVFIHGDRSFT